MTMLVFLPAAAPARVIASEFMRRGLEHRDMRSCATLVNHGMSWQEHPTLDW